MSQSLLRHVLRRPLTRLLSCDVSVLWMIERCLVLRIIERWFPRSVMNGGLEYVGVATAEVLSGVATAEVL